MKWLPIETAPMDGTDVLVFAKNADIPAVASYETIGEESGWCEDFDLDQNLMPIWEVTHWMPLPENPS